MTEPSAESARAFPPTGLPRRVVHVRKFEVRQARGGGDNFGSLTINLGRDENFAEVGAKIWRIDDHLRAGVPPPSEGSILEIEAREETYKGMPSWIVERYRPLEGAEREAAAAKFVLPERIDAEYYLAKLDELIDATDENSVCGEVLREIFDRQEFRRQFRRAPAAKTRHQNYPGGLLEHTINVTTVAVSIARTYAHATGPRAGEPGLNFNRERLPIDMNVLIAAGLLHDIGKVKTYLLDPLPSYADVNQFEGHLPMSYGVVRELARRFRENPPYPSAPVEIDKLLNCILSHHGKIEFGSPVGPACVEAFVLSQADLTDARLAEFVTVGNETLRRDPSARWIRVFGHPSDVYIGDWPPPAK